MAEFKEPGADFGASINPLAIIESARQFVASTGAFDSEPGDLDDIARRFRAGQLTPKQVQEEVDALLGARQDYH